MKITEMNCPNCGGILELDEKGLTGKCLSCGVTSKINQDNKDAITRAYDLLVQKKFNSAKKILEDVIQNDVKNGKIYLGLLMCDMGASQVEDLATSKVDFTKNANYIRALNLLNEDEQRILKNLNKKSLSLINEQKNNTLPKQEQVNDKAENKEDNEEELYKNLNRLDDLNELPDLPKEYLLKLFLPDVRVAFKNKLLPLFEYFVRIISSDLELAINAFDRKSDKSHNSPEDSWSVKNFLEKWNVFIFNGVIKERCDEMLEIYNNLTQKEINLIPKEDLESIQFFKEKYTVMLAILEKLEQCKNNIKNKKDVMQKLYDSCTYKVYDSISEETKTKNVIDSIDTVDKDEYYDSNECLVKNVEFVIEARYHTKRIENLIDVYNSLTAEEKKHLPEYDHTKIKTIKNLYKKLKIQIDRKKYPQKDTLLESEIEISDELIEDEVDNGGEKYEKKIISQKRQNGEVVENDDGDLKKIFNDYTQGIRKKENELNRCGFFELATKKRLKQEIAGLTAKRNPIEKKILSAELEKYEEALNKLNIDLKTCKFTEFSKKQDIKEKIKILTSQINQTKRRIRELN